MRRRHPVRALTQVVRPHRPSPDSKKARAMRSEQVMARQGVVDLVNRFVAARPLGAFKPQWDDLRVMFELVRERGPEHVLELGGGVSTVALAAAVRANGFGHLWSVDASDTWMSSTQSALPDELQEFVTFRHAALPDLVPDFAYLDGPFRRAVLRLEPTLRPGFTLLIDGRHATSQYIRENLQRHWDFETQPGRYIFTLLPD